MGQSEDVREPRRVRKACPAFAGSTDMGVTSQAMPEASRNQELHPTPPARKQGPPTMPLSLEGWCPHSPTPPSNARLAGTGFALGRH